MPGYGASINWMPVDRASLPSPTTRPPHSTTRARVLIRYLLDHRQLQRSFTKLYLKIVRNCLTALLIWVAIKHVSQALEVW